MKICETLDPITSEYTIIDDGTLDIVISCDNCNWIGRYESDSLNVIRPIRREPYLDSASRKICKEDHDKNPNEDLRNLKIRY